MTIAEWRTKLIAQLQAQKDALRHEIEQARKHVDWWQAKERKLEDELQDKDDEQWPLVCKDLGYKTEVNSDD